MASRRVEIRMDEDLFRWMENMRHLRKWSRTAILELAVSELRNNGVPHELPADIDNARFAGDTDGGNA